MLTGSVNWTGEPGTESEAMSGGEVVVLSEACGVVGRRELSEVCESKRGPQAVIRLVGGHESGECELVEVSKVGDRLGVLGESDRLVEG